MWSFEHSVTASGVTRQQVWAVWSDLPHWPTWDKAAEWVRPEPPGEFVAGMRYTIQPRQGPKARGLITRAEPGRSYTDRSPLPLCRLGFDQTVEDLPEGRGVRVTHRVTLSGPLTFFFRRVLGRRIAAGMPAVMDNLVVRASKTPPAAGVP